MSGEARPTTPRLARLLVRVLSDAADRELLLADLKERFEAIARDDGLPAARRWYWFQAIRGTHARLRPDAQLLWRRSWEGVLGDLRHGIRSLSRRPLYTLGVTGTFAIGLASATAVLSVAWHVWLAPMPFPDPDRVVRLFELEPPGSGSGTASVAPRRSRVSPPLLEDLRVHDWTAVEAVAGVSSSVFDWTREASTSRISALVVSPELFGILGISPTAGRTLSDDEDAPEVVLTERFWRRAYGANPTIIGRASMVLDGESRNIVGVVRLPAGYPREADVLTRLAFGEDELTEGMRGARYLEVVARVAPAFEVGDADSELDRFVKALGDRYSIYDGWGGEAVVLSEELIRPYRSVLGLLSAAGVVFLLLAIVNVAGLVAARITEGRQERALRLALGASELRLLRGSSVESLLLGMLGAVGALGIAYWLLGPLASLVPPEVPRIENVRLSSGMVGSLLGVALVAGWGVGVMGYVLSRGAGPAESRGARTTTPGLSGRGALVAGQIALTTLLATSGAGILRETVSLQAIDVGFQSEGVVSEQIILGADRYPTPDSRLAYWRGLVAAAEGRGIDVAIGTNGPMAGANMPWGWRVDAASEQSFAQYHIVSDAYFDVLGIELVDGRTFTPDDREGSEPVLLVNEAVAESVFPGQSAVGRVIEVLGRPKTIVGVVRSTRHFGPSEPIPDEIYVPLAHDPWPNAQLLARGITPSGSATLAALLEDLDPALGVAPPTSYARHVSEWFAPLRLQLIIVGVLATVGTLLATLGLYALVAYHVSSRRRDIGVRMALGASDTRMFSEVVYRGMKLATIGMLSGFAAWYASLPVTGGLLGDVDIGDPLPPIAVAVLVGIVALVASALPAWRSAAVDPAVTLRAE